MGAIIVVAALAIPVIVDVIVGSPAGLCAALVMLAFFMGAMWREAGR